MVLLIGGCARPPLKEIEDTKRFLAFVNASGAAQYADAEYRDAQAALLAAEQLAGEKNYRQARVSLDAARDKASRALQLTVERKQRHEAEEQRRAAEAQLQIEEVREVPEDSAPARPATTPVKKANVQVPAVPHAPKPVVVEPRLVDQVEVRPGENLSMISARKEVYQDAQLWPLIYKANRDQIKDPQQIFPGQQLLIPRDKNNEEMEAARQEARELNLFN